MTIETLPFEHRPRNSIANNLNRINELVDWVNLDTHLYASASGERVTVDDASSVKGLTVDGRSVQDGTPTPDAPIPVQVVEGPLSLVIGDASVSINLQGNALASLPDGTRDELHIDSAGRVWIERNIYAITLNGGAQETWTDGASGRRKSLNLVGFAPIVRNVESNSIVPSIISNRFVSVSGNASYASTTGVSQNTLGTYLYINLRGSEAVSMNDWIDWLAANPVTVYYPLETPQTIDLGYIDPPAIPSGSVVTISASLTPEITLEWWVDDGITALINDLIAYIDYKTEG